MKRYKKQKIRIPIPDKGSFGAVDIDSKMIEDPEGEWVKYEDVEKEIKEAYKRGYFTGQNSEMLVNNNFTMLQPGLKIQPIECNCEIKSRIMKSQGPIEYKQIDPDWICPAHGYKRL